MAASETGIWVLQALASSCAQVPHQRRVEMEGNLEMFVWSARPQVSTLNGNILANMTLGVELMESRLDFLSA